MSDTSEGRLGYWLLVLIWSCAAARIVMKLFFFDIPGCSTGIYLIMGWIAVFVMVPLYRAGGPLPLLWLLIGGLMYTAGGIIYAVKSRTYFPDGSVFMRSSISL